MRDIQKIFDKKNSKAKKISMVTCYDFSFAKILEESNVDVVLVGDSLSMVIQGNESTLSVTLDEMIYHTKIVRKAIPNKFLLVDLPFLSYQISIEQAIGSAGRVMKESGADAVKLEGDSEYIFNVIKRLTEMGIPVMGHVGLMPQSSKKFGGFKQQGKDEESSKRILESSKNIELSGAFGLLLEMIPEDLGKKITEIVGIPTIGIGAGNFTDGHVLVLQDLLGMNPDFNPKFLKKYSNLFEICLNAFNEFNKDVKNEKIL